MKKFKYFITANWDPVNGKLGPLWLVTLSHLDKYTSGQVVQVGNKEYVLGQRELVDSGEVVSYELILRAEILELV